MICWSLFSLVFNAGFEGKGPFDRNEMKNTECISYTHRTDQKINKLSIIDCESGRYM